MRIKITSDGMPQGTRVVDARTGEPLDHVTSVAWQVDANHLAKVTLTLIHVPVEVEGDASITDQTVPS